MTTQLSEKRITCPHCAHHLHTTIDSSAGDQDYYDECPACCNEIHYHLHIDEYRKTIQLSVDSGDK
ncbi:CPXCG motif-containing cysteine-rich protein [Colwellia echini]|uniref:CPXCG motif-containing cysteine-rich protein n=1 Tax=Colwellia echini TaxID=1982103 RepID=A0ABY3MSU9_9GAMM|nr:CPXCG motif-containing cysteine-rich protein [Colwellia echini]TYK64264.1 CPXCG motif-containing cysteine-rich protein [Colwellia echini]